MQSKQLVLPASGAHNIACISTSEQSLNFSHEQLAYLLHDFKSKQAHPGLLCCALAKHGWLSQLLIVTSQAQCVTTKLASSDSVEGMWTC